MPSVPVSFVPAKAGDVIMLGNIKCRVLEDGSRTDNRIGCAEFTLPPRTSGPPSHWHEMHDETFLTTQGTVRFHIPNQPDIDAAVGDFVSVPVRAPHTFSNPHDEEAKFFNTYTPAFYINYFKLLGELTSGDEKMTPAKNLVAMANYATLPVPKELQPNAKK
ncbi:RmlC-like cupin [Trichodelitschia bisporula]|uniref:RmlC-like cupin n=1 Tax=Trichodelitschia bisporula TaxID=703511 RepID=A0A6G1HWZ6_9PEZI|nr:RmlC-like cupin [Trichodelitschia bisporula]